MSITVTEPPQAEKSQISQQQRFAHKILEIKYSRIEELNARLKESLSRERIPASQACSLIISNTQKIPDYLVSSLWPLEPDQNKYHKYQALKDSRRQRDSVSVGCCTIT